MCKVAASHVGSVDGFAGLQDVVPEEALIENLDTTELSAVPAPADRHDRCRSLNQRLIDQATAMRIGYVLQLLQRAREWNIGTMPTIAFEYPASVSARAITDRKHTAGVVVFELLEHPAERQGGFLREPARTQRDKLLPGRPRQHPRSAGLANSIRTLGRSEPSRIASSETNVTVRSG